jgi:CRISPR-associated endonuclease Csn1
VTAYKISDDNCLGSLWFQLDPSQQNELVRTVLAARDNETLSEQLDRMDRFSATQIKALIDVKLPEGFGHLSEEAMSKIITHLKAGVITYDKACEKAGFEHSAYGVEEQYEELPYYGRVLSRYVMGQNTEESDENQLQYGKIGNPTVHISLNQIRKVVNALIKKYGKPTEIVVEVTRDLKNSKRRKIEIQGQQAKNAKRNERYNEELGILRLAANQRNRLRLNLWESLSPDPLNRRCPYSGTAISKTMLFSPEIEIDHIIPFSRSLDDSLSNKVLCTRGANRIKGDRTPYEAFSQNTEWEDIVSRAAEMPPQKARRFTEEASKKTLEDFLARQLTDTAYIARAAREYLTSILSSETVWVVPGHLTGLLRHSWGLNSILSSRNIKEREDHRHHAIDAVVIGCTDRSILSKFLEPVRMSRRSVLQILSRFLSKNCQSRLKH